MEILGQISTEINNRLAATEGDELIKMLVPKKIGEAEYRRSIHLRKSVTLV
jgi:hypothetical protein